MGKYDDQVDEILKIMNAKKGLTEKEWTPTAIFQQMDQKIIGNENYKQALALTLSGYLGKSGQRQHMFVIGPSGTGKTHLIRKLLPVFGIPHVVIDSSSLVGPGYQGTTLQEALEEFFKSNMAAAKKSIIVMDEFDKVSEKVGNNWAQVIQNELLSLVEGTQKGSIDTRNSLWIFLGAFAYTDEMKRANPKIKDTDLLKYGFKNELLGRIQSFVMTDIPTEQELLLRVLNSEDLTNFHTELEREGKNVKFSNEGLAELVGMIQRPEFGMRILAKILYALKKQLIFKHKETNIEIGPEILKTLHHD